VYYCFVADLSTLDEVKLLVSAPWFWGEMDGNQAAAALNGAKRGSYLVRFSAKSEGQFTISYVTKHPTKPKENTVTHTRLVQPMNMSIPSVVKSFCKTNKLKIAHTGRPSKFVVLYSPPSATSSSTTHPSSYVEIARNYVSTTNLTPLSADESFNLNEFAWGDSNVVQ